MESNMGMHKRNFLATHATELVLDRLGFFWPSYHLLDNSSSHVAD